MESTKQTENLAECGNKSKPLLYTAFSTIPLDVEGSNISCIGWIPSDSEKKYMDEKDFNEAVRQSEKENEKVLFKNIHLNWDSCDSCDGYGCSHGSWVYEINITCGDKNHTLEIDDSGIVAYNEGRQSMIPEKEVTVYDFYRMCEIVGINLELSDYALSLLK